MEHKNVRKRKNLANNKTEENTDDDTKKPNKISDTDREVPERKNSEKLSLEPGTYWLTRIVFLRYLSFIYFVAFLVSYNQNKELIGKNGLTPASNYLLTSKTLQNI